MITLLLVFGTFFAIGLLIIGLAVAGDVIGDTVESAANGVGHLMEGLFHFEYSGISFHGFGTFFLGIFFTLFGVVGAYTVEVYPDMNAFIIVPSSLVISGILASGATLVMSKIFSESPQDIRKSSEYIGREGVMTVGIKGQGDKGEILFSEENMKTFIAISNEQLNVGENAIVIDIIGNLAKVKKKITV